MPSETKQCQNCKQKFVIEPDDFLFYEKMKVPAPTWCPECRMMRRMTWRNEYTLYKRKCDATGVDMVSIIAPDLPYKVYEASYWRSDAWDPMSYGRDYDFTKTFFSQFNEFFTEIPHPNLVQKNVVDSELSYGLNLKNCYWVGGADSVEDSAYLFSPILQARDCFDLCAVGDVEHCYDSIDIEKSSGLRFCQNCVGCSDSYLLYDCRNCVSCFGCVGLRNKNFHIFNKGYSKEEYIEEIKKLKPNTLDGIKQAKKRFNELKLKVPRKYASIQKSDRVTGDDILNAKDCKYCFGVKNDTQNCKYGYRVLGAKDGQDITIAWGGAEQFYECVSITTQRTIGSYVAWGGFDIQYSYNCYDCNNIFGCVGLRNKSYCILNKQYEEKEYKKLLPKIILQMQELKFKDSLQRTYSYGDFFPSEFSPYAYNETIAQTYLPKTKEDVSKMGLKWREPEEKQYNITKKVGDDFKENNNSDEQILKEVYECEHLGKCNDHCATAFRIVPQELQFLKKMGLPLPRLCPFCRQAERVRLKNPLHLWHGVCQCAGVESSNKAYKNTIAHSHGTSHCTNEFETPYDPDRKEIIYCESCYNSEIV
jgi:hypothetical protein